MVRALRLLRVAGSILMNSAVSPPPSAMKKRGRERDSREKGDLLKRDKMPIWAGLLLVVSLALASCGGSGAAQGQGESTESAQGMEAGGETQGSAVGSRADVGLDDAGGVEPTMPATPSVAPIVAAL